jgi:hypothetical protein
VTYSQWLKTSTGGRVLHEESVWNREEFGQEAYEAGVLAERGRCEDIVRDNFTAAPRPRGEDILSDIHKGDDHVQQG